jgi:hypothetical protein
MKELEHRGWLVDRIVYASLIGLLAAALFAGPHYFSWWTGKVGLSFFAGGIALILCAFLTRIYLPRRCPQCRKRMAKSKGRVIPKFAVCLNCNIQEHLVEKESEDGMITP